MPAIAATVCLAVLVLFATAAMAAHPSPDTATMGMVSANQTVPTVRPVGKPVGVASAGMHASGAWVNTVSQQTGIAYVAVQAYADTALRLAQQQPSCRLGWTTLAGIGGIESGHGTTGGALLQSDGTTLPAIVGPALDGTSETARIPSDTDSMQWHGDPLWDHAVGPMQFIPSTWRRWGADGNGDGVSDPNNINDAAFATGLYLCASGADLSTGAGWTRAVFSYNHSDDYVRNVLARANQYSGATS